MRFLTLLLLTTASCIHAVETPFTPYKDGFASASTWFGHTEALRVTAGDREAWVNHALADGLAEGLRGARLALHVRDVFTSGRLEIHLARSLTTLENQTRMSHLQPGGEKSVGSVELDGRHVEEVVSVVLDSTALAVIRSGLYDGLLLRATAGLDAEIGALESSRGAILYLDYAHPKGGATQEDVIQALKSDEAFLQSLRVRSEMDVGSVASVLQSDSSFVATLVGPTGKDGADGAAGLPGAPGTVGPPGPQGPEGPMGKSFRIDSLGKTAMRQSWATPPEGFVWGDTAAGITTLYMADAAGKWAELGKLTAAQKLSELQGRLSTAQLPEKLPDSLARKVSVDALAGRLAQAETQVAAAATESSVDQRFATKADVASPHTMTLDSIKKLLASDQLAIQVAELITSGRAQLKNGLTAARTDTGAILHARRDSPALLPFVRLQNHHTGATEMGGGSIEFRGGRENAGAGILFKTQNYFWDNWIDFQVSNNDAAYQKDVTFNPLRIEYLGIQTPRLLLRDETNQSPFTSRLHDGGGWGEGITEKVLPTVFEGHSSYVIHILGRTKDAHYNFSMLAMVTAATGWVGGANGNCQHDKNYVAAHNVSILAQQHPTVPQGTNGANMALGVTDAYCDKFQLKLTGLPSGGTGTKVKYHIDQMRVH